MADKIKTIESKSKTRNGIKRMSFIALSILFEIGLILMLINFLYMDYVLVEIVIRIITIPLGLYIYSEHKTASMKMPWILLILATHVVGVTLFLLVGLNGGTKKMKERYKKVDEQIFPLLPENTHVLDKLEESEPNAYGISAYLIPYMKIPMSPTMTGLRMGLRHSLRHLNMQRDLSLWSTLPYRIQLPGEE